MAVTQQRKDIQGLRAFAVLLVVAGHFFPNTLKGGFIGVDIFFVISGFVITQQMLTSVQSGHKGFFLNFYARRMRRILPSALLVTLVTIYAAKKLLGPVVANSTMLDGAWTTIFLGNFHFHNTTLDYFAAGIQVSPLQHYWSLSIEEQFYLMWPALFLFLQIATKSIKNRMNFLSIIIALSLFTALYQSTISQTTIFFASSTRIWELATGALLAINGKSIHIRRVVVNVGLTLFLISAFFVPQTMQWPRLTTIPIIIVSGLLLIRNPSSGKSFLLENQLVTYVGDLSYILYLWHWPILTIAKSYCLNYGVAQKLLCIFLALVFSVLTHHFFENPIRYSQRLAASVRLNLVLGISSIVIVAFALFTTYQG